MHVTAKYMQTVSKWPSYVLGQYVHSNPDIDPCDWTKRETQIKKIIWTHDSNVLTFTPYVMSGVPCLWCKECDVAYTSNAGNLYAGKYV